MGMGEPMDNFDEVIRSVRILNDEGGRNIGQRHITLSTCGIVEGIDKLAQQGLQVRLAVSLHASEDKLREKIMAVAKKYPLKILLESVRNYQRQVKRRVTFEYCMIKDLNDSATQARRLIKVLSSVNSHVNLIEYNPHPGCEFSSSEPRTIYHFAEILKAAGIETSIRYKRGACINAACGQLGATALKDR
jgi:23S rRNA (adenine2503-C2)-methyltransferase